MILPTVATLLALSGTTYTNITGRYEARNASGVMLSAHDTLAECIAVLPLPTAPGKVRLGTCKLVYHIDGELNCDDAVRPALATFQVIDGAAVVYSGPWCAPGETCTTPADWDDVGVVTPTGRVYTFTEVGGVRLNDDGTIDLYLLVQGNPPNECWAWKWIKPPPPTAHVVPEGETFVPPDIDDMDGTGETGDPTWPGWIPPRLGEPTLPTLTVNL